MQYTKISSIWALLRFALGFILLWAFFDKLLGLGIATPASKAWISGASPTLGYLKSAAGPFAGVFQSMAGSPVTDALFMAGLLGIGLALILGIGMKIASFGGILMMLLMWFSHLPPQQNPILDEHIVYALVFLGFYWARAGHTWGLGKWWSQTSLVKRFRFLE